MTIPLEEVARAAAYRYRRTTRATLDDLEQEAWLAIMRAKQTFDPKHGTPLEAYCWKAALRALSWYVDRTCAPVGGSRSAVAGIDAACHSYEDPLHSAEGHALPDAAVEERHWTTEVRERLDALLSGLSDGELAADVLLGEYRPSEVSERRRVPVKRVYRATTKARALVRDDAALRELFAQRCGKGDDR